MNSEGRLGPITVSEVIDTGVWTTGVISLGAFGYIAYFDVGYVGSATVAVIFLILGLTGTLAVRGVDAVMSYARGGDGE